MDPIPTAHHVSMYPNQLSQQHGPRDGYSMHCILPLHPAKQPELSPVGAAGDPALPLLGVAAASIPRVEPHNSLPLRSRAAGTSIPASLEELGQDASAQGSQSSPITQLSQGTSMSVTLSKHVYNPATALGSQGCCSAGTQCCWHPDATVPCLLWYPWGCVHPHGEGLEQEHRGCFYA